MSSLFYCHITYRVQAFDCSVLLYAREADCSVPKCEYFHIRLDCLAALRKSTRNNMRSANNDYARASSFVGAFVGIERSTGFSPKVVPSSQPQITKRSCGYSCTPQIPRLTGSPPNASLNPQIPLPSPQPPPHSPSKPTLNPTPSASTPQP